MSSDHQVSEEMDTGDVSWLLAELHADLTVLESALSAEFLANFQTPPTWFNSVDDNTNVFDPNFVLSSGAMDGINEGSSFPDLGPEIFIDESIEMIHALGLPVYVHGLSRSTNFESVFGRSPATDPVIESPSFISSEGAVERSTIVDAVGNLPLMDLVSFQGIFERSVSADPPIENLFSESANKRSAAADLLVKILPFDGAHEGSAVADPLVENFSLEGTNEESAAVDLSMARTSRSIISVRRIEEICERN